MPEITPMAAVVPAAPAAPAAGVAPVSAPGGNGTAPAPDFMGQLSAALKGLAKAVSGKAAPVAIELPANAAAPAQDADAAPAKTDAPADDVTELMATLGLMLVPTPVAPLQPQAGAAGAQPVAAEAGAARPLPQAPAPAAAPATPQADAQAPLPTQTRPIPTDTQAQEAPVPAPTNTPAHTAAAPDAPVAQAAPADAGSAQLAPADTQAPPAPVAAAVPQHVLQAHLQDGTGGGAFQQGTDARDEHSQHTGSKTTAVSEASDSQPAAATANAAEAANAVAGQAAPTPVNPEQNVRAADVAQQIAQQVDLYRLPGNKGVRIQLHPDDLGGVQVTLKYAAGGSLELHISVEHASTGSLVEAGLSQLRDALATQGFHPDRMVMSITAPSSASGMDFSSSNSNTNGSSYRSDTGFGGFASDGQGQPGQQRDPGSSNVGNWQVGSTTSDADSVTSSGDASRASGAASRIDYRV